MHLKTEIRVEALKTAIENGDTKVEMIDKFTGEWNVSSRTILRLISTAQKEMKKEMREKKGIINTVRHKKIALAAEEDVISEMEADIILGGIARGNVLVKKAFNTAAGVIIVEVPPDYNARLRALDMYYKRMGSYIIEKEDENEDGQQPGYVGVRGVCFDCANTNPLAPGCTNCPNKDGHNFFHPTYIPMTVLRRAGKQFSEKMQQAGQAVPDKLGNEINIAETGNESLNAGNNIVNNDPELNEKNISEVPAPAVPAANHEIKNKGAAVPRSNETKPETNQPAPPAPPRANRMMVRYGPGGKVEPYYGLFGPPRGRRRAKTYK